LPIFGRETLFVMRRQDLKKIFHAGLLIVATLAGCSAEPAVGPALTTGKPPILRAIDNRLLSVVVRIDAIGREFIGEQRTDGSWFVEMDVPADMTHNFVASWYANYKEQRVLLVEQRGEFYAGSTQVQANPTTVDVSDGNGFDSDCDGQSNLAELESNSDPLSTPGCGGNSQATEIDGAADAGDTAGPVGATEGATDGVIDTSATNVTDNAGATGGIDGTLDAGSTNDTGGTPGSAVSSTIPELVPITAGCFQMGSPESDVFRQPDERQHKVCVDAFQIGRYEVTFDQYNEFAGQPGIAQSIPNDRTWGMGSRPVINIAWSDAVAYTQWLSDLTGDSYRLPTEAEWEYAARGGTQTLFWTGDTLRDDQEHFGSADPYGGGIATGLPYRDKTIPVGSLQPNPFGLYDMLGNVIEFTCSLYSDNYENQLEEKCDYDMTQSHMARGAAYNYIATWARSSTRTGVVTAGEHNGHVGFRVVREIP